jgi:hypothetical protein
MRTTARRNSQAKRLRETVVTHASMQCLASQAQSLRGNLEVARSHSTLHESLWQRIPATRGR